MAEMVYKYRFECDECGNDETEYKTQEEAERAGENHVEDQHNPPQIMVRRKAVNK